MIGALDTQQAASAIELLRSVPGILHLSKIHRIDEANYCAGDSVTRGARFAILYIDCVSIVIRFSLSFDLYWRINSWG